VGLFNKWLSNAIGQQAENLTSAASARAENGGDPISAALGANGADQVRQLMAGMSRFGFTLDADEALGQQPDRDAMQNPFKRITDPVEGSMHIVGCTALDPREMRAPCHITYVIQAAGIPAFSGDQVFELWSRQWPNPGDDLPVVFDRAKPDRIQIQFDQLPTHADSARMHAEQLAEQLRAGGTAGAGQPGAPIATGPFAGWPAPTTITPIVIGSADPARISDAIARAEQALGMDLNGDGVIGGPAAPPPAQAPPPPAPPPAADDTISRLERLAKLRDTGVITPDEFEGQKRKILGE
jgi:hypothetical protein